jgi:hypothetical protein
MWSLTAGVVCLQENLFFISVSGTKNVLLCLRWYLAQVGLYFYFFINIFRSKSSLLSKLEARKKKRHGAEYAKLSKQMLLEENANQRKTLENKQQESQLMGDNSANRTETSDVLIGNLPTGAKKPDSRQPSAGSGSSTLGVTLTGNQEQDWVNMLMASPLFKQINDLEDMLEKSDSAEEILRPHVKGETWL